MRFLLLAALVACGVPSVGWTQADTLGAAGFPVAEFSRQEALARWLVRYDRCAWVTSDSAMAHATTAERARLGSEWFCYEANGAWRAVYGRYHEGADSLDVVLHYEMRDSGQVRRLHDLPPRDAALAYARALTAAHRRLPPAVRQSGVRFNQMVRPGPDGPEVWLLPAWQPNNWLLYGMELRYAFDASGRTLRDSTVLLDTLRGSPPDRSLELTLDGAASEVSPVGHLFFAWAYGRQFKAVRLSTRGFRSQLLELDGQLVWIHAKREAPR